MAYEVPVLEAQTREKTGSRYSQRLREEGKLPAVIYGNNAEPASIALDAEKTYETLHAGKKVISISVDGKEETVLAKDVQFDYLGDHIIHVDLVRIDIDQNVEVKVPLKIVGENHCKALASAHTFLETDMTELVISCKANLIPQRIDVSVAELGENESITVGDLKLAEGISAVTPADLRIASVTVAKRKAALDKAAAAGEEAEEEAAAE